MGRMGPLRHRRPIGPIRPIQISENDNWATGEFADKYGARRFRGPAAAHGREMAMKRLVTNALAGAALASGLSAVGCDTYQKCVDPCWPERYNQTARREVVSAFAPQVQNGHI